MVRRYISVVSIRSLTVSFSHWARFRLLGVLLVTRCPRHFHPVATAWKSSRRRVTCVPSPWVAWRDDLGDVVPARPAAGGQPGAGRGVCRGRRPATVRDRPPALGTGRSAAANLSRRVPA